MPNRAGLDKNPSDISNMFDQIAQRYDLMNDLLSLGRTRTWRRVVTFVIDPKSGERILDLAAGTGTSSYPLAKRGAHVFPTDISAGMLRQGLHRYPNLHFIAGNALNLPFCDAAFDAVTMSFGLRNVPNVAQTLRELRRVTRPGGRLVICELSSPTLPVLRQSYWFYLRRILPLMSRFSSNPIGYEYLRESIITWPNRSKLSQMMIQAGWKNVEWCNLSGGIVAIHRAVTA